VPALNTDPGAAQSLAEKLLDYMEGERHFSTLNCSWPPYRSG